MKRLAALLVVMILLLSACGGKQNEPKGDESEPSNHMVAMTMEKTAFSQETEDVLKLLEIDGGFFDFCVDESVNGFSMNVWVLTDGEWVSSGEINGKIENRQGQIGVQLLRDGCNFFQLNSAGHTKYAVKYDTHLNECAVIGKMALDTMNGTPVIEAGKEQFLCLELGWKSSSASVQMTEDFRNSGCDAGVAATITFTAAAG